MQNCGYRSKAGLRGWFSLVAALLFLVFFAALQPVHAAGGETYGYDGLGRLILSVSSDGVVTQYVYDPAGNIEAVIRGGAVLPPTLGNVAPASIRRASQVRVTLTGTNLQNAGLQALDRELTISGVTRTATSLAFDLAASPMATLGASGLRVSSASGNATINISVRPRLPQIELAPLPIAVPPDGRPATINLLLSNADDQAHTIALSTVRPDIATVSPASVTIAAGSTSATLVVAGRLNGNTELRLESATLGNFAFPIFVLAEFAGITTARADLVGVILSAPPQPTGFPALLPSEPVGLVLASTGWLNTSPRFVVQGGSQTLSITGFGLPAALTGVVEPADGITVGPISVAADGKSATVSVSAAANAAQGPRRLVLREATAALTPFITGADLLDIVAPAPEVTSVQPLLLNAASTVPTFQITGRNLQDATSVQLLGGGVTVGANLVSNPEGTSLLVSLAISPVATPGPRTVVVSAPAGASSSTPSVANTVEVVPTASEIRSYADLPSPLVGLAVGPLVVSSSPATVSHAETVTLLVNGQFLSGVNAVVLIPAAGLTVGTPSVNAAGTQISVQVTASVDAPLGSRRIDVLAGGNLLPVAGFGSLQLQVTEISPVVSSIEPTAFVPSGQPFTLVVRGSNLQGATAVRITPATGITIGTPTVNAAGTEVRAQVTVAMAAALGVRIVTVLTPAGESSAVPGPNNQFTLQQGLALFDFPALPVGVELGPVQPYYPVGIEALFSAPLVGVAVGQPTSAPTATLFAQNVGVTLGTQQEPTTDTLFALNVGVLVGTPPNPNLFDVELSASAAGVVRGPMAISLEPAVWVPGQSGVLVVRGNALPAGSTLQFVPASGATLNGAATVDADGRALRQALTIDASSTLPGLEVVVVAPGGALVPVASTAGRTLVLLPGIPEVVSLEPILARQGEAGTLLIRGTRLTGAALVSAEPASGIDFASDFTVNAAGTEIQIRYQVRLDAPLGARVIRVFNRLGGSSAAAAPANTFTVFPSN